MNYGKKYNRKNKIGLKSDEGEIEAVAMSKFVGHFEEVR